MKILPLNYTNNNYNYKVGPQYSYNKFELQNDIFQKSPSFNGKVLKSEMHEAEKCIGRFLKKNNLLNEKLIQVNVKYVNAKNNIANADQALRDLAEEIYRSSYITALFGNYKKCTVSQRSSNAHDTYKQLVEIFNGLPAETKAGFVNEFNRLKGLFSVQDDIVVEREAKLSLDALRTNLDKSLEKYNIRNKAGADFLNEEKLIDIAENKSEKLIENIYYPQNEAEEFLQKYTNPDFDFHAEYESLSKKINFYLSNADLIKEFLAAHKKGLNLEKNQKYLNYVYSKCETGINENAKTAVRQVEKSTIGFKDVNFSRKVLKLLDSQEVSLREFIQKFRNAGIEVPENIKNY